MYQVFIDSLFGCLEITNGVQYLMYSKIACHDMAYADDVALVAIGPTALLRQEQVSVVIWLQDLSSWFLWKDLAIPQDESDPSTETNKRDLQARSPHEHVLVFISYLQAIIPLLQSILAKIWRCN